MGSQSLYFLMGQYTKGRRRIKKGMDGVNRHFRTDLVIKVNGLMTNRLEEEFLVKLMVVDMKDSLKMKNAKAMAGLYQAIKKLYMKGNLIMMFRMALGLRYL